MASEIIDDVARKLALASKRLYDCSLVRGTSGNVSARIPGTETFLIKASGVHMGFLKPDELVLVDIEGNKIKGKLSVSVETPMHAAIYKTRKDINAVMHTHAPTATAFGIAGKEILPLQVETLLLFPDGVPIVPFEHSGSRALAEAVQKKITNYNAVILENHGIVTVASTIEEACNLSEMVEEAAKVQYMAETLAGKKAFSLDKLKRKFKT